MSGITQRLDYLDNLKVFLTVLVIFHHAGQAYGPGGGWAYHPSNPAESAEWLWRFFSVNAAFFMGLYFMISGYFVPRSYDKQGFGTFMWKKFMRLGIPTLVIGTLITVLAKQPDIAHTWFLEQLLFFCFIYALIRLLTKKVVGEPKKLPNLLLVFFGMGLLLAVVNYFVTRVSPQDNWIWFLGFLKTEPAHYPQYILFFILGIVAYRQNWFSRMPNSVGLTTLLLGLVMAVLQWTRGDNAVGHLIGGNWPIYEAWLSIFISFGLVWLFRQVFAGTNKFMKWCSAQAYGAYVVHLLLMLGFQFMTDKLFLGGGTEKFLFIGVVVTIESFVTAWLLRLIPGVKKVL